MILCKLLTQVLFLYMFHESDCQRRIHEGKVVNTEKKYMVYLLKASISPQNYDNWLCGGALVSPDFIVTSAACVTDVKHLYAIAGYKKYVSDVNIYNDPCTKAKKKKIIFTCIPLAYKLVYNEPAKWSHIDIAVAKVESPYDFADASYAQVCSYTPAPIMINYEIKYQEPGIDAIALGWGHLAKYREDMDLTNYNQDMLNYAPTLIEDKEECKEEYSVYEGMAEVIDQYMLCTNLKGNLDDGGGTILKSEPIAQGCLPSLKRLRGELSCENAGIPENEIVLMENSRKDIKTPNVTINKHLISKQNNSLVHSNKTHDSSLNNKINKTVSNSRRLSKNTRRHGICQNDHGGPLVTWVGAHEVLIGVASAYKITEGRDCIGPFLFTSTQCNGAFLDCALRYDPENPEITRRGTNCSSLFNENGIKLHETNISWINHPDGPAENEKKMSTQASVANTDTNTTINLINSTEEEIPKHEHNENALKLVNINTTNLTNFDPSEPHITNLSSTTNKTNLITEVVNDENSNFTSAIYRTNASKSNVTIMTILTETTIVSLSNTTILAQ